MKWITWTYSMCNEGSGCSSRFVYLYINKYINSRKQRKKASSFHKMCKIPCYYSVDTWVDFLLIGSWAQFLRPNFFPPLWGQIVWRKSHEKGAQHKKWITSPKWPPSQLQCPLVWRPILYYWSQLDPHLIANHECRFPSHLVEGTSLVRVAQISPSS
jgi:hypothetical protein